MKWRARKTKQEHYRSIRDKWLDYFTYLPVTIDGYTYWLCTVERKDSFTEYMYCEWNGFKKTSPNYGKRGYLVHDNTEYRVKSGG